MAGYSTVVCVILVVGSFSTFRLCHGIGELSLNGDSWMLKQEVGNITVKAQVPGSVYTDLIRSGILDDPYYRFNDIAYRWVSYSDWRYTRTFEVTKKFLKHEHIDLVLDGLDTVAVVTLNGFLVAKTDNMFRRYIVDVTSVLKVGVNTIDILFISSVTYAKTRAREYAYEVPPACPPPAQKGECFFNFIRKEACSFSWDWGPAFPTMGIWKNISLHAYEAASIQYVTIETSHIASSSWMLIVDVFFDVVSPVDDGWLELAIPELSYSARHPVKLPSRDKSVIVRLAGQLDKVKPWWPNGFGEAKLYTAMLTFTSPAGDSDSRQLNIGFRTVELVQDRVPGRLAGNTFYFRINGIAIFAKGSNWIPADIFQERITFSYLERLMLSAVDANMNMLRVWGGGVYESEDFYQLADRFGIMIWQDFMFACALYPTNEEFLSNVREEVTHQVRRLKYHPSIVLWAGNNENEGALASNWFNISKKEMPRYKDDYVKLYIDTIRPIVLKEDSSRPFVPSSPSNGVDTEAEGWVAKDPQSPWFGDTHDYNYSRNSWNSTVYAVPRFGSEFGLQSWCSLESLLPVSSPAIDWDMTNSFPEHRQHHTNGETEMLLELQMNMKPPNSVNKTQRFADFVYLTQINQAVGIRTEVELYRRSQSRLVDGIGYTMGALYWQLNDIWQAPTWASIEYGGKWKMLHYFARRFFSKTALSAYIEGDNISLYYIDDNVREFLTESDAEPSSNARLLYELKIESDYDEENSDEIMLRKLRWSLDGQSAEISSQHSHKADAVTVIAECFKWDSFTPIASWNITFAKPKIAAKEVFTSSLSTALSTCKCDEPAECFLYFTDISSSAPDAYLLFGNLSDTQSMFGATVKVAGVRQIDNNTAEIRVTSSRIAIFVWLECQGFPGKFSDNGFLLVRPEIVVQFHSWETLYDFTRFVQQLTVRSLADIYS